MWYKYNQDELTINVYLQPGAKNTELLGLYNNALKIRLNAPPIEGRANKALIKFIAELFQVPLRQVSLIRGEQSKHKVLTIKGSAQDPERLIQHDP